MKDKNPMIMSIDAEKEFDKNTIFFYDKKPKTSANWIFKDHTSILHWQRTSMKEPYLTLYVTVSTWCFLSKMENQARVCASTISLQNYTWSPNQCNKAKRKEKKRMKSIQIGKEEIKLSLHEIGRASCRERV